MRPLTRVLLALCAGAAFACSTLLPDARVRTEDSWKSYDEAKSAIEGIVPYRTTRTELSALRIDPALNPAITILSFPDVAQRFAVGSAIDPATLEKGIRECLSAGNRCSGFQINVHNNRRDRIGNFWLDLLNFRREVDVTGWSFNALVLLVGDTAVYAIHGGQPKLHELEVNRNPLGPLQGMGEPLFQSTISR